MLEQTLWMESPFFTSGMAGSDSGDATGTVSGTGTVAGMGTVAAGKSCDCEASEEL